MAPSHDAEDLAVADSATASIEEASTLEEAGATEEGSAQPAAVRSAAGGVSYNTIMRPTRARVFPIGRTDFVVADSLRPSATLPIWRCPPAKRATPLMKLRNGLINFMKTRSATALPTRNATTHGPQRDFPIGDPEGVTQRRRIQTLQF